MTSIREAILLAADHIEANPDLYHFQSTRVPDCGTPGCMVGWIAFFQGKAPDTRIWGDGCIDVLGCESQTFSARLLWEMPELRGVAWTSDNKGAAIALRAYADKYHPAEAVSVALEHYPIIRAELARIFAREVMA